MSGSRVRDLRKRMKNIENVADPAKLKETVDQLSQLAMGLSLQVFQMRKKLAQALILAKKCDWRTLAMMKLEASPSVSEDGRVRSFEQAVIEEAEKMQVENFEKESAEEDRARGYEACNDETAQPTMFAISQVRLYKSGQELLEERVVRSKIRLGDHELFPELDGQIVGMKVGDKKRFPFNIAQATDEAEVELLGLRKKKADPAPNAEVSSSQH